MALGMELVARNHHTRGENVRYKKALRPHSERDCGALELEAHLKPLSSA
jgi:hypothetical protein